MRVREAEFHDGFHDFYCYCKFCQCTSHFILGIFLPFFIVKVRILGEKENTTRRSVFWWDFNYRRHMASEMDVLYYFAIFTISIFPTFEEITWNRTHFVVIAFVGLKGPIFSSPVQFKSSCQIFSLLDVLSCKTWHGFGQNVTSRTINLG